jgi:hypothetical protein
VLKPLPVPIIAVQVRQLPFPVTRAGPGGRRLATVPAIGQGDATLPGAFRPCRSSRLRRFAPLRTLQGPRPWGPRSTRVEPAPFSVSPATDPGVHAVSAPAALSALSRSVLVPFGARNARIARSRAARAGASPVMPYPSKRFPSAAAVPSSPMGVAFSPVPSAALPRDPVASCVLGFRWRRPAARPCSAAEVRVQGAVTSGPVPDASLGLILERALKRAGWKMLP